MSREINLNKAALIGTIENEPVLRTKKDGSLITNIILVTIERRIDKSTKEKREFSEKHHIILAKPSLEQNFNYLVKGGRLYVEGSIKTENWISKKTGKKRSRKIISCDYYRILKKHKTMPHITKQEECLQADESLYPKQPLNLLSNNIALNNQLPTTANNSYGTL